LPTDTTPSGTGTTPTSPNNTGTTTTGGETPATTISSPNATTAPPNTTSPPATNPTPPQDNYPPDDFIGDDEIDEIITNNPPTIVVADMDGTIISAEALQAIRANGVDVTVILENGFTYTIIADSIQPDARAFDLDIEIMLKSNATVINGVRIPANSIVIMPNFSGAFGFEIKINITAEQLANAGINGNNIGLWHVDYAANITDRGRVRRNADNSVNFTIDHASFYVLSAEAPINENGGTTSQTPTDTNPATGVVFGFTAVSFAGLVIIASRKKKRKS
jgi:hypothetical protein